MKIKKLFFQFIVDYFEFILVSIVSCFLLEKIANDNTIFINNTAANDFKLYILVPIYETFAFQFIFLWVFYNIFEDFKIGIFVSALFFGGFHFYNIYYIIYAFFAGLFLAYVLAKIYRRYSSWLIATSYTAILHIVYDFSVDPLNSLIDKLKTFF